MFELMNEIIWKGNLHFIVSKEIHVKLKKEMLLTSICLALIAELMCIRVFCNW